MPWSPPEDDEWVRDPRLDPFRERAGLLLDERDEEVGDVYLRVEPYWSRTSGHLWWSRWEDPREAVHGYLVLRDGSFTDWLDTGEGLDEHLTDWVDGSFRHAGARYRVVWRDDEESALVRQDVFGLDD